MQQLVITALHIETRELTPAEYGTLPQALQVSRQQLLILTTPLQANMLPALAQADAVQPQTTLGVLLGQCRQRCNKPGIALTAKQLQVSDQSLQFTVVLLARGQRLG